MPGLADEVLVTRFSIELSREKFRCLQNGTRLNAEGMNVYMSLSMSMLFQESETVSAGDDTKSKLFEGVRMTSSV